MKLFCFLILFFFVHVSTNRLTDYKREICITNAQIKLAGDMDIKVGDTIAGYGVEKVIKEIVNVEDHVMLRDLDLQLADFALMNIMIAVPEYYAYFYDLDEAIHIQRAMQDEISSKLGIAVPEVPDQNFGELVLTQLGEERRRFTKRALQLLIIDALGKVQEFSVLVMCRLIALFMSTKFPTSFIKNIKIGKKNTCFIQDDISAYKIYRDINGKWWQVNVNDIENKLNSLEGQLVTLS
ncbi:uncharacterized protein LOC126847457 [Adelges cooleyi]|uniref:uncharacterized protein LOC126847457 n=1 Tax=Adelges cooleyi TaxID=133065 RepID=UPI00217F8B08|nr:uncharacterized protein LOC126847457 [Adelges cooleyi]XP_050443649.1 uncharacterized protein LOC126847457 [Adelges cooleyi]